jgi:hypothetical protein
MRDMIQPLESRRLLSVTVPPSLLSTIVQAESDAIAIKTSLQHDVPVVAADLVAINAAFHGLSNSAQDRALFSTLHKHEMTAMVLLKGDILRIINVGRPDLGKALGAIARFKAHPGSATQAAATAAIANLQNAVNPLSNKFGADVVSIGETVTADLSAIQSANSSVPAVQNAVAKLQSDFTNEFAALQPSFQSLQTDFQNLLNGLTALA